MKLFKESIDQLRLKNQELQANSLLQPQLSKNEAAKMSKLFNGLKEDNDRLAEEIRRLVREN